MDLVEKTKNINRHPWEISRADSVINVLADVPKDVIIADVGSGDQYFTTRLTEITMHSVFAVDKEYTKDQPSDPRIKCYSDIDSLLDNSIDYIFLMDVLEHIENDLDFLTILSKKLKVGGKIIITVPAWQILFSTHDKYLRHFRRYNSKQLRQLVSKANLKVVKNHYFYTSLIPARILSLILEKSLLKDSDINHQGIGQWKYDVNNILTKSIYNILNLDFKINEILSKLKLRLPGLSLFAVVIKEH